MEDYKACNHKWVRKDTYYDKNDKKLTKPDWEKRNVFRIDVSVFCSKCGDPVGFEPDEDNAND